MTLIKQLVALTAAGVVVLTGTPSAWADDSIPTCDITATTDACGTIGDATAQDEADVAAAIADAGGFDAITPASDAEADQAVTDVLTTPDTVLDDGAVEDPFTPTDAQLAAAGKAALLGL